MSKNHIEYVTCPECGKQLSYTYWDSVNVSLNPEFKEKVLDKSLFNVTCKCGFEIKWLHPFLYHDMNKKLMIQFVSFDDVMESVNAFENIRKTMQKDFEQKDYLFRIVINYNDLVEKIYIADAGFNDEVIELMKNIFVRASKKGQPDVKDFDIRFYPPRLDSEIDNERDYHFNFFDFEKGTFIPLPIQKEKFTKHTQYIESQKTKRKKYDYIVGREWADSILDESAFRQDIHQMFDSDLEFNRQKYADEYGNLKINTKNINDFDSTGYPLLYYAVLAEDSNEVKSLLENGANPNVLIEGDRVVLHWALQYGISVEIIDLLVSHGADINIMTSHKDRPLDMIDTRKSVDYLKHMFDLGALCKGDALIRSYAGEAENTECIKFLLSKGYSIETKDRNGFNANYEAICDNSSNEFLEQFLSLGGNPNEKTKEQPYFFNLFAEYDGEKRVYGFYIERLKILIKHGLDINSTDNFGRTAMMWACLKCVRIEMIKFLLSYKPDLSLEDSSGKDVFDYIEENKNLSNSDISAVFDMFFEYENLKNEQI